MTTTIATALTPVQQEAARRLVDGTLPEFAAHRHRSPITTRTLLFSLRTRVAAPGSSRAVLAHVLLSTGQVPPPTPAGSAPDFTDAELLLLRALAQYAEGTAIAGVCDLPVKGLRNRIDELCAKAGAADPAHLVALGHAWQILVPAPPQSAESTSGAAQ
ncbi:hypothetical protein [Streptomyces sp. NPDC003032]